MAAGKWELLSLTLFQTQPSSERTERQGAAKDSKGSAFIWTTGAREY